MAKVIHLKKDEYSFEKEIAELKTDPIKCVFLETA